MNRFNVRQRSPEPSSRSGSTRARPGALRSGVGLLGLLLVTGLAACDNSTGPSDDLTQAEAQALAQVILTQTFAAGDPGSAALPASTAPVARQVVDFGNEVSVELACPLGGSVSADVSASGTIDSESGAADLQFSSTQIHEACQVQPEEADEVFTLNGSPSIASTFAFISDGAGTFQTSGSIQGSVSWAAGDRSGSCVIALEFSGSGDAQGAGSFSLVGGVCSTQISQQVGFTG